MAASVPTLDLSNMIGGIGDVLAKRNDLANAQAQATYQQGLTQALLDPNGVPPAAPVPQSFLQRLIGGLSGEQPAAQKVAPMGPAGAPAAAPSTTATVSGARPALPAAGSLHSAIIGQESGGNPNIGASVNGAQGIGQIMPATFARYAQPGERIDNPADNLAVSKRITDTYLQKYGDPQRAAVAYFSGEGNVAPPGSPTPYIRDVADGNGKTVSSYVSDVMRRMSEGAPTPTAAPAESVGTTVTPNGHVIPDYSLPRINAMISNPATKVLGEALLKRYFENAKDQSVTTLTTPEDRAKYGIQPTDTSIYQVDNNGKLSVVGGKAATPQPHVVGSGGALVGPDGKVLYKAPAADTMSDQTADFLAERVLAGDTKALIGLGRGAQGAQNITKVQQLVAEKAAERGIDAKDMLEATAEQAGLNAQQRTFGTQTARMASASTEAQGAIALGRQASADVPRGNWVPVNKAIQAVQAGTSDPALAKFGAANLAIINTYARAINPNGVPTVSDKQHAEHMLSTATGPDAYNATLDQMQAEIDLAHKSPQVAQAMMKNIRKGRPAMEGIEAKPLTPEKGPFTTQQRQPLPQGYTPAMVVDDAKKAIAAGKDPAAIAERLKSYGIDPANAGIQ